MGERLSSGQKGGSVTGITNVGANPSGEIQRRMIGHGMLILLIGLLAGIGLLISLIGGLEAWPGRLISIDLPGGSSAWARFHMGQLLNAFLIVLVALALPVLKFEPRSGRRIGWFIVAVGWANTLFYAAALFAPNRALTFGNNRLGDANLASLIGLAPALVFAVVSVVVVVVLARQAFRRLT
ncbi:styrene-oxide isomerase StyC [Burkholderia sp. MR1-5-21]